MTLKVGDRASDFTLSSGNGTNVTLAELAGKKVVVLYFYPKDGTPGCTAEACSFRDQYEDFVEAGAAVFGISADSASSHESFSRKHSLPMPLLCDPDGRIRALYGVKPTLGLFPGRVTFVIDKGGIVRHVFASQLRFGAHAGEALDVVRQLRG